MKSERRHELQHNDLAEWIVKANERILPYRSLLLGVGLLVVVLLVGVSFWRSHQLAQAADAWNAMGIPVFQPQFAAEQTISGMEKAAQTYPDTPAGQWATVFAADTALTCGMNRILTEKKVGIEYLNDALKRYNDALDKHSLTIPGAEEQAMFGKARAMEALIQKPEDAEHAKAAYKELNEKFSKGMFKAVAEERIKQLEKRDTLTFYETLAQYAPKPKVESPVSQLGKLGDLPDNPPSEPLVPSTPIRSTSGGPLLGIPAPPSTPTEPEKPSAPPTESPKPNTPKTAPRPNR